MYIYIYIYVLMQYAFISSSNSHEILLLKPHETLQEECGSECRMSTQDFAKPPIDLGKFHHDLTATEPWESWLGFGKSSPFMALIGRKIQISEIL